MDPFDQKKSYILQEIASSQTDASPKGSIDVKCIPLMEVINAHPNMVSTSSCSGRVSVFLEGVKQGPQIGAKGHEGRWLFVTHDKEELGEWWTQVGLQFGNNVQINSEASQSSEDATRYILFKFEPFILHVKCRDPETARQLYTVAMASGYRESGIGSNNLVAVRTSIRLDVPIGQLIADLEMQLYVSEEYLAVLTRLAHARFEENERKYEGLQKRIEKEMFGEEKTIERKETKEERRVRKINEGMARRDAVLREKEEKREQKRQMEERQVKSEGTRI